MDDILARRTAELALGFLNSLDERPVGARVSVEQLQAALRVPLGDEPLSALQVVEELAAAVDPGLMASQSGRYFGFVIGGALDSAVAADWLTSAWDQNGGGWPVSPAAAVADEVVGEWLLDVLGLPPECGVGLTTGCQMAHVTCLAAARHAVLERAGWDVEADGLFGAPPIRVIVGERAHASVFAALRMLGLGSGRVTTVPADDQGRMRADALGLDGPAIVIVQAGEVNTGAIDPLPEITAITREHGGWCHVDGAFGLWAAASPAMRHLVAGAADADSWT